jgi:hypothetical protein
LDLIYVTVDDDHLTVQVGKRTEAKISVLEEGLNADLTIVYSSDKGARGRDLEDGVDRPFQVLSEGRGYDGRRAAAGSLCFLRKRSR